MENMTNILDEARALLRVQEAQLQDALQKVRDAQQSLGVADNPPLSPTQSNGASARRPMSAEAKEKASKRMKAYWRKKRREKGK